MTMRMEDGVNYRTITSLGPAKGARALVRADFNVPMKGGRIRKDGDTRIREALPTIRHLRKLGMKVVLLAHLGRPKGRDGSLSLKPVAARLGALLRTKVTFVPHAIDDGDKVESAIARAKSGVVLLENIRFYPGEEKNDRFFSRRLASLGDIFVNDAFGVAHRAHASNVGITQHLPSYAGSLVEHEMLNLDRLLHRPKRPYVVLLGGAKLSGKLPTLTRLLKTADSVLVGGGMANAFIRAKGHSIGRSFVAPEDLRKARALVKNRKIVIPVDVVVTDRLDAKGYAKVVRIDGVRSDEYVVDIGPETIRKFSGRIKEARTIAWNGPVGLYEIDKFSHGSVILARVVASRSSGSAFGVVGGGDTIPCLERTGMADYVDHISTGGGAMLDLLAGKTLPGIEPLIVR